MEAEPLTKLLKEHILPTLFRAINQGKNTKITERWTKSN